MFCAEEETGVVRTVTGLGCSVFGGIWGPLCVTVSETFVPTVYFSDREGTGWLT